MAFTTNQEAVAEFYIAALGRSPEKSGLDYWVGRLDGTTGAQLTLDQVRAFFVDSSIPEVATRFPAGQTNQEMVESIYENVLSRAGDTDGVAYWVSRIAGTNTDGEAQITDLSEIITHVLGAATAANDAATLANKVTFAENVYTTTATSLTAAQLSTSTITDDDATLIAANATIDALEPQTFTLTTGTDTFTGTANNDTYTAALLTLGDTDVLDGGAGTDTLNAEINANVGATANWDNIETMNFTAYGAKSIDMSAMSGVTTLNTVNSTGAITVNNAQTATMAVGFAGTSTNSIDLNHAAGKLSGAADVLTVNLNTASAVSLVVDAGFESATFNVTGTNDVDTFTKNGIATVTLAGSGSVDFANTTLDGISTLSAGAYTGAVTTGTVSATTGFVDADIVGATTGTSVILGSGNDNIGFTDATSATTYSNTVKLGAGNDKLLATTAATGATYIFAEAGDDAVSIGAHDASDLIDMGTGTDTLTITGNSTGSVLRGVENITINSTATSVVVNSADQAAAVTYKVAGTAAAVTGLKAASTVTLAETVAGTSTATTFEVGYAATEAAATVAVNAATTDNLKFTNITALTINASKALGNNTDTVDLNGGTTSLTINATKAVDLANIITPTDAAGEKLASLTVVGSEKVVIGDIVNDAKLSTVSITAASTTDSSIGAIADATSLTSVTATSSAAGMAVGAIGGTTQGTTAFNVNVSGATTAQIGLINATAAKVGDVTVTATNGTLTAGVLKATELGTVSYTSTNGIVAASAAITTADATGITVNMTAKTTIDNDNDGTVDGEDIVVTNTLGGITASLGGAAAAGISYGVSAGKGVVNLSASNTGGLNATIINGGTTTSGETSTVTLGNATSSVNNTLDISGIVDTMNITGGTGADNIVFESTAQNNVIKAGTLALGGGTDSVSFAEFDATGANSGTYTGLYINLGATATVTNGTASATVTAGQVKQYNSAAATNVTKIDAAGSVFTLTDVEAVVGSINADYIIANAAGTAITGAAGDDTLVLGAGADTIVFSGHTLATNGADTIGTFSSTDVFNFASVLTSGAIINTLTGTAITLATTGALATERTSIALTDEKVMVIEVALKAGIDTAAEMITALTDAGVLDAVDTAASADAIIVIGGADDDTVHYVYGIDNDGTAAVASGEIVLLGTITGDITNGIAGLTTANFSF